MNTPSYLVVSVMLNDQDEPERPLADVAADILDANIAGVAEIRAAHNNTDYGWLVPVGPSWASL